LAETVGEVDEAVGAIGDVGGGFDELGWVAGGVADAAELCPSSSKLL
jgi:hypothetical protein